MIRFVVFVLILLGNISCSLENQSSALAVPTVLINNNVIDDYTNVDLYFNLQKIKLSEEDALAVGGLIKDFIPLEDRVVFIDRHTGVISAVSYDGEVLWILKAEGNSPDVFAGIKTARINLHTNLIEVYDNLRGRVLCFNVDGEFQTSRKEYKSFLDRAALSTQETIYDLNFSPQAYLDNEGNAYEFGLTTDGESIRTFKVNPDYDRNYVPFVVYDNFSFVGKNLFYHKNFFDTVYAVSLNGVYPSHVVNFAVGENSQEVMKNRMIDGKYNYLYEENVPYFLQSIPINGKYYTNYRSTSGRTFSIDSFEGSNLVNTRFFEHNGELIPLPKIYRNGAFLSVINKTTEERLKLTRKSSDFPKRFDPAQNGFLTPDSDIDGLVFYILTPR